VGTLSLTNTHLRRGAPPVADQVLARRSAQRPRTMARRLPTLALAIHVGPRPRRSLPRHRRRGSGAARGYDAATGFDRRRARPMRAHVGDAHPAQRKSVNSGRHSIAVATRQPAAVPAGPIGASMTDQGLHTNAGSEVVCSHARNPARGRSRTEEEHAKVREARGETDGPYGLLEGQTRA